VLPWPYKSDRQYAFGFTPGVLFYATSFNPPLGCLRIISEEELATLKSTELANNAMEAFEGEASTVFKQGAGELLRIMSNSRWLSVIVRTDALTSTHALWNAASRPNMQTGSTRWSSPWLSSLSPQSTKRATATSPCTLACVSLHLVPSRVFL
jgi:hypothetical protein